MQPSLGWTLLSEDALRRAETLLLDDEQKGVRDEIGFLALHQAYANRFFPGTSVLHTRLRYALFVPWIYQKVARESRHKNIDRLVEKEEKDLTGRLIVGVKDGKGIIGKRVHPKSTAQPPSMIYWSALKVWGILHPDLSGLYRNTLHKIIAQKTGYRSLHDDDGQLLNEEKQLFDLWLPEPPFEWSGSGPLDFQLKEDEKEFLRHCLSTVLRPDGKSAPSLLARLVEKNVDITENVQMWAKKVVKVADESDRAALRRGEQAAALAAIGRGVYAALVEGLREEDSLPTENFHREYLPQVIAEHSACATKLTVDEVRLDDQSIPSQILLVLKKTQAWLASESRDPRELRGDYELVELQRKGRRARLARSEFGRQRRAEWLPDKHTKAEPLRYRWENVRQLLMDLQDKP